MEAGYVGRRRHDGPRGYGYGKAEISRDLVIAVHDDGDRQAEWGWKTKDERGMRSTQVRDCSRESNPDSWDF